MKNVDRFYLKPDERNSTITVVKKKDYFNRDDYDRWGYIYYKLFKLNDQRIHRDNKQLKINKRSAKKKNYR